MTLPHRQERREMRYPLHLPVLLKVARKEMHARSENISLGGILLSSDCLIPEGSTVEVSVGVEHTADPGILLSARGQVLRVQSKLTGDFAVAIRLERSFRLPFVGPEPQSVTLPTVPQAPNREKDRVKNRAVFYRAPYVAGWHTET